MIHSSHRDRKAKAIAEVMAMIAGVHPERAPYRPHPVHETDESLWESITEFRAACGRYTKRTMQITSEKQ